jgi:hypothetical protein
MKGWILVGVAMILAVPGMVGAAASQHTVSVTLNYDFSVDNACSSSVTTGCVKQFNIYDITGGATPVKLFSITAPSAAAAAVTGITGTSGAITLKGEPERGAGARAGESAEAKGGGKESRASGSRVAGCADVANPHHGVAGTGYPCFCC